MPFCRNRGTEVSEGGPRRSKALQQCGLLLALVALVLVSCGSPAPTPGPTPTPTTPPTATVPPTPTPGCTKEEAAAFLDDLDALFEEWDDTAEIAGSTGRGSLPPVIESLKAIKRRTNALDAPCVEAAAVQDAVVEQMDAYAAAYLAFMAQKTDAEVNIAFAHASDMWDGILEKLSVLNAIAQ